MTTEQIRENLDSIEKQLNDRANQLLAADPLARELLGLKRGLEMCAGEPVLNGSVGDEKNLEAISQS